MQINKLPLNRKALIVTVSVVFVVALGYGIYAATSKQWPFTAGQPAAKNATTPNTTNTGTANDDPSTTPSPSSPTAEESPKTPIQNESPADIPQGEVAVTLTSVTTSDNSVRVKSLIKAVTNEGSCTLTFTKDSKTVTKSSGIQALPNSSTCKGFTLPKSDLQSGIWHIELTVTTGGKTGSASKDYKVQ